MQRLVSVHGPPGVGKSTIVQLLKMRGMEAIDIEECGHTYPEREAEFRRMAVDSSFELLVVGAADLDRADLPQGTISVLLLPPKATYLARTRERSRRQPDKRGQHPSRAYENFVRERYAFDHVLEDIGPPSETLAHVLRILG